jgi:mannosyltransferase
VTSIPAEAELPVTSDNREANHAARRAQALMLSAILVLAAVIRLHHLSTEGLWFDEAATAHVVMAPLADVFQRFRTTENTPPLHYVIRWIWIRIFGHSEFSLRMPSVIAGVASVYFLYQLLRQLGHDRAGLIAALLLACSQYQIYYSQEARSYELMVCLSLLSSCFFVRLMNEPTRRRQIQWITATTLLLYTHLFGVFAIAAQNVAYFAGLRRPRPALKITDWLGVQLATGALFLPFVPIVIGWMRNRGGSFWIKQISADDITASYVAYAGSAALFWVMLVFVVMAVVIHRRKRVALGLLLSLLLLPVVVPIVASMLLKPLFVARYGIVASPALCALVALGIDAIKPRAASLVITLALAVGSLMAPDFGHKEDWRGVASYIAKWARTGDYVVINRRDASRGYEYYNLRPDVHFKGFWGPFVTLGVPLEHDAHAWLVLYDPNATAHDIINNGHWTVVSQKVFYQITVYELAGGRTEPLPPGLDMERFNAKPVTRDRDEFED